MENQTTTKFKRWEDLDITDDFIFTRVMRNKKLCRTLPKGSQYKDLKQNFVIFICTFDPFLKGKPIYSFQNYCIDYGVPIPLADGTEKIFSKHHRQRPLQP